MSAALSPTSDPVVGPWRPRAFGPYDLLAPLARGGMGAVWLARRRGDADVPGFCAVKTVLRTLSAQPAFLTRFRDEARVVVTLNHRALCHVFDVGVVDGESYLAMELVEGATVQRFLTALREAGEALPLDVALMIADELVDALAHVHERRDPVTGAPLHIVHRDISPQNMLVTFQGGVKVVDFGVVSSSLRQERTEAGHVIGKLHYMAPEQARGEPAIAATDVYSAGIVLWELVTGRRFWGERDKGVIMMELVDGAFLPPLDDDSGVPPALRGVLRAALEPDPTQRLADGAALQAALAAVTLPRAGPRALRDLVGRVLRPEQERLAALMRGASAVVVEAPPEATRITHLATSEPTTSRLDPPPPTTTLAATTSERPPPGPGMRAPPPPRAALAVGTALGSAIVVLGVWFTLRTSPTTAPPPPAPPPPAATTTPAPLPTVVAPLAPPPTPPTPPPAPATPPPAPTAATTPRPTTARPGPRPPATPLPDLGAQLDYLERWCVARAPCAGPLVAERRRLGVLDAAALRQLRDDATRCVARCRR
jgi:serine/threonine protein kinase